MNMNITPVKKGQKVTLDDVFEPIIYLNTFPHPKGNLIASVKVVGLNDQKVKKTLNSIRYLTTQLVNNFQVSAVINVEYDKSNQTIYFSANSKIDTAELEIEALEYDVQDDHFHLSQGLFTILNSNFDNIVAI